ncbi:MAG: hypothetical protein HYW90_02025 [Candidatus Sungbacteria bacterium]|nr:hypothetical protein [Candidatus Sungbacteria bacterium]
MEHNVKISPKDVFMHLLAIIALYISAVSFGVLVFQFIDLLFPDQLSYFPQGSRDAVRWALAALVVVFPVYVWTSWVLARDVSFNPEKRELKSRKWLYYFTLFAASGLIIGDIVALIYNFLGGDLSIRFLLKIITILFIATAVFCYYLWNIRHEEMASQDPRMRVFIFVVVGIVVVSAVAGFFVAGSPFRERLRKFDERRAQDLQSVQWQIVNYWQRKEKLPVILEELRDDISGYAVPQDPESGGPYEYRVLGGLRFELCADFKTSGAETAESPFGIRTPAYQGLSENWTHGIGRTCFTRVIDPELYPPIIEKTRVPSKQ